MINQTNRNIQYLLDAIEAQLTRRLSDIETAAAHPLNLNQTVLELTDRVEEVEAEDEMTNNQNDAIVGHAAKILRRFSDRIDALEQSVGNLVARNAVAMLAVNKLEDRVRHFEALLEGSLHASSDGSTLAPSEEMPQT